MVVLVDFWLLGLKLDKEENMIVIQAKRFTLDEYHKFVVRFKSCFSAKILG